MINIDIKPFSINKAWKGRRYKTESYKMWRSEFSTLFKLEAKNIPMIKGYVQVDYAFFIENYKKSDGENFIKTTSDSIVENGLIEDDRFIKKYTIEKFMLEEGEEPHIEIHISPWLGDHYQTCK